LIIDIAEAHSGAAVALGERAFDVRQGLDGGGVVRHERGDIAGVADAGGAGADQHQISPEGADAVENFLPAAFAHRQHGDHGGDADDDAKQRESCAKNVDAQRAPRGNQRFLRARHQADGAFEAVMVRGQILLRFVGDDSIVLKNPSVLDAHDAAGILRHVFSVGDEDDRPTFGMELFEQR
jgi:hypothetical protein